MICSLGPVILKAAAMRGTTPTHLAVTRADRHIDTLSRLCHRAAAFARERRGDSIDPDWNAYWPLAVKGFKAVAHTVRTTHRRRPRLLQWKHGIDGTDFETYKRRRSSTMLSAALWRTVDAKTATN